MNKKQIFSFDVIFLCLLRHGRNKSLDEIKNQEVKNQENANSPHNRFAAMKQKM